MTYLMVENTTPFVPIDFRQLSILSNSQILSCIEYSEGWELTKFIWNFGLITSCDVGSPKNPRQYFLRKSILQAECFKNIKRGDIVWVPPSLISEFQERIFPFIPVPFVLVISDGDASFPSDCLKLESLEALLSHENIIHIFTQNYDYQGHSKKISPIPIGIDFHTIAYKGTAGEWGVVGSPRQQEAYLLHHLRRALPTYQRKCRAFVDFHHSDTMHGSFKRYLQWGEDRASIFKTILSSGVVDHGPWMNREELWKTKLDYAFSISPHGNGLDCHRTWEDLAVGCIVIVKSSPLDPLFEGLPVVIIKDWNEIHEKNFQKWILKYGDAFTNPAYREKLTYYYWMEKIRNVARPYKSS
jgi:hypothetical protein